VTAIDKVEALLSSISREDLAKLPHEHAMRFARALRRIADAAEGWECEQLSGPLAQLKAGERAEDSDEDRCTRPAELG
jgi:hypothetical protein